LGYIVAVITVSVGIIVYWHLKWSARRRIGSDTFETFFLAGGRVGRTLTAHNSWGLGFSFANAIWYFAFLGYYFGPWIFLLQLPWVFSVGCLALLFRKYVRASQFGTVHGFISHHFGARAALVAAGATLTGYVLNSGFEMFYSAHLLSVAFGIQYMELIIAFLIAVFVAAYCTSGGYYASIVTDRYQNILGTIALGLLIIMLMPSFVEINGNWSAFTTQAQFSSPPWHFVLGVSVFAFFFNFVDMANWQSLAANRDLPTSRFRGVQVGLLFSASVQLIVPAFAGVWLGVMLKVMNSQLADDELIQFAFAKAFQNLGPLTGLVLGIVVFGFLSLTLSSSGSYVVAAMQTLSLDMFKRREAAIYQDPKTDATTRSLVERDVLDWAKRNVIAVCLAMVATFSTLYYGLRYFESAAIVFQFQFVMYGAAVTLAPVVLAKLVHSSEAASVTNHSAGLLSIALGLLFVIVPFAIAAFFWNTLPLQAVRRIVPFSLAPDAIINLTPLLGLIAALFSYLFLRGRSPA
jgi:hypothetical protein